jgi:hypothetical protein
MSFNADAARAGLLDAVASADELLLDDAAPVSPWFLTVEGGTPMPPTTSLADVSVRYAGCSASSPYCPAPLPRVAYTSRLDPSGTPWAAVCSVAEEVSRRVGAPACGGEVTVATEDRGECGELVLDAAGAAGETLTQGDVVLRRLRSADGVLVCSARLQEPVLVQSIAVGTPRGADEGPLAIKAIYPEAAQAGTPFNVQPNGQSAIGVAAIGATSTTRVAIEGVELPTRYVDPKLVTALVPDTLIARPGRLEVQLRDRGLSSEPVFLELRP